MVGEHGNAAEGDDLERLAAREAAGALVARDSFYVARYDAGKGEITVSLPADSVAFRDGEKGVQIDLDFLIDIYENQGAKKDVSLRETRTYVTTDPELLELKEVSFTFTRRLPPGTNYADIIIKGAAGTTGKVRKLFRFKVK